MMEILLSAREKCVDIYDLRSFAATNSATKHQHQYRHQRQTLRFEHSPHGKAPCKSGRSGLKCKSGLPHRTQLTDVGGCVVRPHTGGSRVNMQHMIRHCRGISEGCSRVVRPVYENGETKGLLIKGRSLTQGSKEIIQQTPKKCIVSSGFTSREERDISNNCKFSSGSSSREEQHKKFHFSCGFSRREEQQISKKFHFSCGSPNTSKEQHISKKMLHSCGSTNDREEQEIQQKFPFSSGSTNKEEQFRPQKCVFAHGSDSKRVTSTHQTAALDLRPFRADRHHFPARPRTSTSTRKPVLSATSTVTRNQSTVASSVAYSKSSKNFTAGNSSQIQIQVHSERHFKGGSSQNGNIISDVRLPAGGASLASFAAQHRIKHHQTNNVASISSGITDFHFRDEYSNEALPEFHKVLEERFLRASYELSKTIRESKDHEMYGTTPLWGHPSRGPSQVLSSGVDLKEELGVSNTALSSKNKLFYHGDDDEEVSSSEKTHFVNYLHRLKDGRPRTTDDDKRGRMTSAKIHVTITSPEEDIDDDDDEDEQMEDEEDGGKMADRRSAKQLNVPSHGILRNSKFPTSRNVIVFPMTHRQGISTSVFKML